MSSPVHRNPPRVVAQAMTGFVPCCVAAMHEAQGCKGLRHEDAAHG